MSNLPQRLPQADGWLPQALHRPSPNFDARPAGCWPELLVIHAISLPAGQFLVSGGPDYVMDLLLNKLDTAAHPDFGALAGVRVSSHFLIRRDGQLIQLVGASARAWHAGRSEFMGRERCNDFSIGVELEGCDQLAFEPGQYQTLAALTQSLSQRYPLRHITGHQQIAPTRKTDPGPCFDWQHYQQLLSRQFSLVATDAIIHIAAAP